MFAAMQEEMRQEELFVASEPRCAAKASSVILALRSAAIQEEMLKFELVLDKVADNVPMNQLESNIQFTKVPLI